MRRGLGTSCDGWPMCSGMIASGCCTAKGLAGLGFNSHPKTTPRPSSPTPEGFSGCPPCSTPSTLFRTPSTLCSTPSALCSTPSILCSTPSTLCGALGVQQLTTTSGTCFLGGGIEGLGSGKGGAVQDLQEIHKPPWDGDQHVHPL